MKRKSSKLIVAFILMLAVSCDEPETVVTNYVHADGSVTRKIEMRNLENKFEAPNIQVPFDSTWTVRDSVEIDKKGDTTWVKRAEKVFRNVDQLNYDYKADSSANKNVTRHADFKKTFRWFNTGFRFSETVDKKLEYGYPIKDYLNEEELSYFFSPQTLRDKLDNGTDSLRFKTVRDSIDYKTEFWAYKNLVSEFIGEFSKLTEGKSGKDLTLESLKARENEFMEIVISNEDKLDSLWNNGVILGKFIGDANALKFKKEADSTINSVADKIFSDFKEYDIRVVMPGRVIGSNGFIDSSQVLLWPVKSDFFLSEPYVMWVESRTPNVWAWIVSAFFLVFVLTGIIMKIMRKG